jgi:6-pyruvoyltetrahydropterin/6-carboxytetrahydropterin synthase
MYKIKVEGDFSSAHNLRGYKGKCEELHGHNWKVEVALASPKLDKIGMVMDFKFIKERLSKLLDTLDHKYLNNISYFKKVNPTSENIAKYIYDQLKKEIPVLDYVTVWESDKASATYYVK